jgi:hypothetical protein
VRSSSASIAFFSISVVARYIGVIDMIRTPRWSGLSISARPTNPWPLNVQR